MKVAPSIAPPSFLPTSLAAAPPPATPSNSFEATLARAAAAKQHGQQRAFGFSELGVLGTGGATSHRPSPPRAVAWELKGPDIDEPAIVATPTLQAWTAAPAVVTVAPTAEVQRPSNTTTSAVRSPVAERAPTPQVRPETIFAAPASGPNPLAAVLPMALSAALSAPALQNASAAVGAAPSVRPSVHPASTSPATAAPRPIAGAATGGDLPAMLSGGSTLATERGERSAAPAPTQRWADRAHRAELERRAAAPQTSASDQSLTMSADNGAIEVIVAAPGLSQEAAAKLRKGVAEVGVEFGMRLAELYLNGVAVEHPPAGTIGAPHGRRTH